MAKKPKWVTAKPVKCSTMPPTLAQAKKQWSTITRHLLNPRARRAMAKGTWMHKFTPSIAGRDGYFFSSGCRNGRVYFEMIS